MDKGGLVPDELVVGLIKDNLDNPECQKGQWVSGSVRVSVSQSVESLEGGGGVLVPSVSHESVSYTHLRAHET